MERDYKQFVYANVTKLRIYGNLLMQKEMRCGTEIYNDVNLCLLNNSSSLQGLLQILFFVQAAEIHLNTRINDAKRILVEKSMISAITSTILLFTVPFCS